jgi:hypothetical protein
VPREITERGHEEQASAEASRHPHAIVSERRVEPPGSVEPVATGSRAEAFLLAERGARAGPRRYLPGPVSPPRKPSRRD